MEIPVKSPVDPDWILTTPETKQFKPILLFMPVHMFLHEFSGSTILGFIFRDIPRY
jgi:hypothetical protein